MLVCLKAKHCSVHSATPFFLPSFDVTFFSLSIVFPFPFKTLPVFFSRMSSSQELFPPAKVITKIRSVNSCRLQRDEVHPVLMQQGYNSIINARLGARV